MTIPEGGRPRGTTMIRRLRPDDSIAALTALLHEAYLPLAEAGFRFVASHQSEEVTRLRSARGECFLALDGPEIVGTLVLGAPGDAGGCDFYVRPGVATLHQFAVHPSSQRQGIGSELLRVAGERAVELGAAVLALDTAEGAADLLAFYRRRGFAEVGRADWRPAVNYPSLILAKGIGG
jgi:GNAT superfamily N-acetyltransferase